MVMRRTVVQQPAFFVAKVPGSGEEGFDIFATVGLVA